MKLTASKSPTDKYQEHQRAHPDDAQCGWMSVLELISFVPGGERKSASYLCSKDAIAFTEK